MEYYETSQANVRWMTPTTEYERLLVSGLTEQVVIQAPFPCGSNQLPEYGYATIHTSPCT